jgi:hypothetical protein
MNSIALNDFKNIFYFQYYYFELKTLQLLCIQIIDVLFIITVHMSF